MNATERYEEIDLARGIALVMMILFHTLFDLNFFGIFPVDVYTGFWHLFAIATASLFLLLVGVSLSISRARAARYLDAWALAKKFVFRGAGIVCLGVLVTLVTWLYLGEGYIVFGILSVIGVSVICSPLFFRFGRMNAVLGITVIIIGFFLATIPGPAWLVPFGIHPETFWSVDYEPIFPWLGIVLIGIALGTVLYPDGKRAFEIPALPDKLFAPITFMGRHSLLIYLVHQPLILAVLYLVTGVPIV
jgi:uncharacterized membrane protein